MAVDKNVLKKSEGGAHASIHKYLTILAGKLKFNP